MPQPPRTLKAPIVLVPSTPSTTWPRGWLTPSTPPRFWRTP